jgi:hypothetical protein
MPIAKKYFCFHGLDRKRVGLKRVRIAKKNHSSLLQKSLLVPLFQRGKNENLPL